MSDDNIRPDWTRYGIDQVVVEQWVRTRFGDKVFESVGERTTRILEEVIELHQAEARDVVKARADAHALVDRVFGKPAGQPEQEVGGVIVTLLAYCALKGVRLDTLASQEISRITAADPRQFKAKQTAKADLGLSVRPQ
jgi:hypothetical protein